jgi:hypothetical protein
MYYKLFTTFYFIIVAIISTAQSFSLSPYSKFGIGDLTYNTYVPGISMGYTSIAQRSNRYVNQNNPAAATAIDTLSFITDISIVGRTINLKNNYKSHTQTNTDVSFIAIGFPITKKWKTYIGIAPISNVGYKISEEKLIDTLLLSNLYKGDGGFSEVFFSNGFDLIKTHSLKKTNNNINNHNHHKLALGLKTSYIFGSLDKYTNASFPEEQYIFDLYKTERIIANDIQLKTGLQYEFLKQEEIENIKTNKLKIIVGFTYGHLTNIKAKQTRLITKFINIQGAITKDTIENIVNKNGHIQFPRTIGSGITIEIRDKFSWATDFIFQEWSSVKFFNEHTTLKNSFFIGSGIQYIPDPTKFYYYWKMINYRLGLYYNKTYLNINSKNINEFGITFGLGLPISKTDKGEGTMIKRKLPPMINLSFSYSNRGTLKNNLIKEQFLQFSIGLNLHDIWFVKRKFN